MDDDGDLHEQILHIEAHIEELADVIESCRKFILISKAVMAAGGTLILAIIIRAVGFDPTVMIGALAAVIGGTVVCGSNTSTLKQTTTAMKAAEAPEPSWSAEWIFGWSEAARWDGDNDTEPAGSRGCSLSFSCGPCADLRKCHPFAPAMTATGVF
jgi:hypothetical protein